MRIKCNPAVDGASSFTVDAENQQEAVRQFTQGLRNLGMPDAIDVSISEPVDDVTNLEEAE